MKSKPLFTRLAATAAAITTIAIALCGCGATNTGGEIPTLDLAAAIDNPRPFDLIYMSGRTGSMQPTMVVLDAAGRRVAHVDSLPVGGGIIGGGMALHDGRLVVRRASPNSIDFGNDPDFVTSVGTRVPLLDLYSSDMQTKIETITTIDKGTASLIDIQTDASGNPLSISVYMGGADIMANAGDRLVVKESLSDTVMHYRGGALRPAYTLPTGKYTTPPEAWGLNPTSRVSGEYYTVKSVMESDRWVIVQVAPVLNINLDAMRLVFDRSDPDTAGFAVTDGTSRTSDLMLDGLPVTPMQILDGQLLGYIPALAIYDNAGRITNPALKAIAQNIREESNPVLIIATLTD